MKWVLEHFQILAAVAAAIAYYLTQQRQAAARKTETPRATADADEKAERTRRVQAEIRRKIAERRGAEPEAVPPPVREFVPPLVRPTQVPPLDPFGGPMRRIARKIEEAARFEMEPADDSAQQAALERQAKLAEQMRALEAARQAEQRRAAAVAARIPGRPSPVPAVPAGGGLREQLRDAGALRRAIVLREVLGAPVGFR